MKFLEFLDARSSGLQAAERRFEILKFLSARHFGSHKQAAEFLKFTPEPPRNRSKILNFTPKLRNRFGILKFIRTSARLADTAQNFISQRGFEILKLIREAPFAPRRVLPRVDGVKVGCGCGIAEKRRAVKLTYAGGYLNSMRRYIARFCSAAVRHGYEVGRAENFSKFDLAGALLNFISLLSRKFKLALLKFTHEVPRDRSEILNFTPELSNRFEILKFTLASHKFKPASIPFLNFISNFTPPAYAIKFKRGAR